MSPELSAQAGRDALDRLGTLRAGAEGRDAEVALAARAEAGSGHADHLGFGEEAVEEIPRGHAGRRADPDVRRIAPAVHGETSRLQARADDAGVLHVVVDLGADLLLALRRVDGRGGALNDIRRTVRLRRLSAEPELVQAHATAIGRPPLRLARHDRVGHPQAGESGALREAAGFDGPLDLVDRARDLGIPDVRLVGGVVDDHRLVRAALGRWVDYARASSPRRSD